MLNHLAALIAAAALALPHGRVVPGPTATQAVRPLLVNAAWLKDHLKDKNLVVLHVGDPKAFATAHLPGARNVSLDDISVSDMSSADGLMLEMPALEVLRQKLEAFGISNNSEIVIYSAQQYYSPSTRVLLTLDYVGLGDHSVILDGGLPGWTKAGLPVEQGTGTPPPRGSLSVPKVRPIIVDGDYVEAHVARLGFSIVDARGRAFYDGVMLGGGRGAAEVKGHIPSAKSVPFGDVWTDSSFAESPGTIRALFAKAGVAPTDTIIAYCHIGQQATSVVFAARLIGQPVLLYDGSMNDWSKRPNAKFEAPAKP